MLRPRSSSLVTLGVAPLALALAAAIAISACGADDSPDEPGDSGHASADAASVPADAASRADVGTEATPDAAVAPGLDAQGAAPDAGPVVLVDAGTSADAGAVVDGGDDLSGYDYDLATAATITLKGASIETSAPAAVTIEGSTATIVAGGTYLVTGTLTDGQLRVNAPQQKLKVVLGGASIASKSSAGVYVVSADSVKLIFRDGTVNSISDGASYGADGSEPSAALFSNGDLKLYGEGTGSLTVTGNSVDGIACDDDLLIKAGTLTVTAKDDAIRGKDSLTVEGGVVSATAAAGHALKADNEVDVGAGVIAIQGGSLTLKSTSADGVHAAKELTIDDGTLSIAASAGQGLKGASVTVNGGEVNVTASKEGVEGNSITVNGGTLRVTAKDDGLNATFDTQAGGTEKDDGAKLALNGGYVYLNTTTGDAIDSNWSLTVTGGTVVAHGPQSAPEVGMDVNGTALLSGGTVAISAPNAGQMLELPASSSGQVSVLIVFRASKPANTLVHVQDASGASVFSFAPSRAFGSILFSSPALAQGATYTVLSGGSDTGTNRDGLYTGGAYSGGTSLGTVTLTGKATKAQLN